MLPEIYRSQFSDNLKRRALSANTNKALRYMLRRMNWSLDECDLRDPKMMMMFRYRMADGTRSLFDTAWGVLRQTEVGVDLQPNPPKPMVLYPHPLYADLMHLGSVLGNEQLSTLTWGEAMHSFGWEKKELDCAGRCWWWFMPEDVMPTKESPLIVKDAQAQPMRQWQVQYIINSPVAIHRYSRKLKKVSLVEIAERAIGVAHVLQVEPKVLRLVCDRIVAVGDRVSKIDQKAVMDELDAILVRKDIAGLIKLAEGLPVDPFDDTPKTW